MIRTESNVVKHEKTLFYRRFVDDIMNKRKKNERDVIFEDLNKYHSKINVTIQVNSCKSFDTKIISNKGNYSIEAFRKTSKLPVYWSSRVPKRYQQNAIIGDLHRSNSNFEMEIKVIKPKFRNANYSPKCLNSVIHQFLTPKNPKNNDSFNIPPDFFEEIK